MNVDLHTHTYPASDCSRLTYAEYIGWCTDNEIDAVALTNHGNVEDNRRLGPALAAEGVLLIDGVEISTLAGDFVVFSPDLDYLASFRDLQDIPHAEEIPEHAAVVWVHPAAGGGRSGAAFFPGIERMAAGIVDAIEVFNGSWLADKYVDAAERLAAQLGVARTGGSDAHVVGELMSCYTELPDPVRSTADVVAALRERRTIPHRREARRKRRLFGLF